jgi:hypothetical protein
VEWIQNKGLPTPKLRVTCIYRRKYGATKTVKAFSATLRNEVDLSQVRKHLLEVVQDAMQPAHVSLWLRKDKQPGKPNTNT